MTIPAAISLGELARRLGRDKGGLCRAVQKGRIPRNPDGTFDEEAVRYALTQNTNSSRMKPLREPLTVNADVRTRQQLSVPLAAWKARGGLGYDYQQLLVLGTLLAYGPSLVAKGMRAAGSTDENEIARAAAMFFEVVDTAAVLAFDVRKRDHRTPLPRTVLPELSPAALKLYFRLTDEDLQNPEYDINDRLLPEEFLELAMDHLKGVNPV